MGLWFRNGRWYIDLYSSNGVRIRRVVGRSKRQAERALAVRKSEVLQGKYNLVKKKIENPKFKDFAKEYVEYAKTNKKTWRRDVASLHSLNPYFGEKKLSEITPFSIEAYKGMRREKVKPATVNRDIALLKHIFNMAIKWEKAETNPMKEVKLFKERNHITRILSSEEEIKLMNCAYKRLKPIVITALTTGMRIGEILNLTWDNIDFKHGVITIDNTKGGEVRSIPMNSCLTEVLKNVKKSSKSRFVFPSRDGNPYTSVRKAFDTARRRAGISNLRLHDLRHTFASRLVMKGVDLVTVQKLLGHKSIELTMRYSHPAPEHRRKAVELLNNAAYSHCLVTGAEKRSCSL